MAISAIYTPLSQLHTFGLNLRTFVAIYDVLSQSTHFCCNFCKFVAIYAFLSWCQRFCDLRVLGAKKNCESWVPSQKNRISSHVHNVNENDLDFGLSENPENLNIKRIVGAL